MLWPSYTDAGQGLFCGAGISCLQRHIKTQNFYGTCLALSPFIVQSTSMHKEAGCNQSSNISQTWGGNLQLLRFPFLSLWCDKCLDHVRKLLYLPIPGTPIQCQQISTNGVLDGFCRIWFHMSWYVQSAIEANQGIEGISDQGTAAATGQERCSSKKATSAELDPSRSMRSLANLLLFGSFRWDNVGYQWISYQIWYQKNQWSHWIFCGVLSGSEASKARSQATKQQRLAGCLRPVH